jgi:hypothetical protein
VFQTPYREDERIDAEVLQREIEWLYDCGADGIVMAMVSERWATSWGASARTVTRQRSSRRLSRIERSGVVDTLMLLVETGDRQGSRPPPKRKGG